MKRPHTQLICVRCSLSIKTGKFTCVYWASTSRRTHTYCLLSHVNLSGDSGYSIGNFKWKTHAKSPTTGTQNFLFCRQKYMQLFAENIRNRKQNMGKCRQELPQLQAKDAQVQVKYPQVRAKISTISGNTAMTTLICSPANKVTLPATCFFSYVR